jgi:hypothetical protein
MTQKPKILNNTEAYELQMSRNTNDRGWFVVVKTRLTTKRKRKCKGRGDYIHIVKG